MSNIATVWSTGSTFETGYSTFSGNYFYLPTGNNNHISKIGLDGSIINSTWATTVNQCNSCIAYGGYLYVSSSNTIRKIQIKSDGTSGTNVVIATISFPNTLAIGSIDNINYLFVTYEYGVATVSLTNFSLNLNWLIGTLGNGIVVVNNFLYLVNANNLLKISLTTVPSVTTWATGAQGINNPLGLGYFNGYFYISNYSSQIISRVSISDANDFDSSYMQLNNIYDYPGGVTTKSNYLYISGIGSKNIYKGELPPVPPLPCFKEDSKILTDQGYKLVQDLRKGDLVKTLRNDYLPVVMIGKREMRHDALEERIKDQLYQYSNDTFEEIFEPLVLTGCHSILVDLLTQEQKEKTTEVLGKIYITDNKYRLPACADEKASVYKVPGDYTIYHIALENEHYTGNYGIYANGLLVESCSKRYLKELSEMEILE